MEASTKIFNSSARHYFSNSVLPKTHSPFKSPFPYTQKSYHSIPSPPSISLSLHPFNAHLPIHSTFKSNLFSFPSTSVRSPLASLHSLFSSDRFARIVSGFQTDSTSYDWHFASSGSVVEGGKGVYVGDKRPIVTVVLLGWLGAKRKHLRRYVELYNSKGMNAVTFVASAKDVLGFDLGRRLQERISRLTDEIASWLSESQKDGRDRFLIFHTFSNTGWLAYGGILDNLKGRDDLLEKIRGCVVDSGGDPDINPKVWAAGFTAAFLKKNSSSTYSVENSRGETGTTLSSIIEKQPPLMENLLMLLLEKLFSYILNLPDVKQRLTKIISTLSKSQPYPQLYLYSTADEVIPLRSVELFIEGQKRMEREVLCFNFGSSPHVDHYRNFTKIYVSQIENFLDVCFATVKHI